MGFATVAYDAARTRRVNSRSEFLFRSNAITAFEPLIELFGLEFTFKNFVIDFKKVVMVKTPQDVLLRAPLQISGIPDNHVSITLSFEDEQSDLPTEAALWLDGERVTDIKALLDHWDMCYTAWLLGDASLSF